MRDKCSDRQRRIFEGLSAIGQEIAGFYEAGSKIYFEDCPNGAYFLLHAAREIDGGLRDVLAVDYTPGEESPDKHKESILFSLGAQELEGLAEDWFKASKKLHRYAHRHGAWKSPRQLQEVKPVWINMKIFWSGWLVHTLRLLKELSVLGKSGICKGVLLKHCVIF